jgi:hypothetical protein
VNEPSAERAEKQAEPGGSSLPPVQIVATAAYAQTKLIRVSPSALLVLWKSIA